MLAYVAIVAFDDAIALVLVNLSRPIGIRQQPTRNSNDIDRAASDQALGDRRCSVMADAGAVLASAVSISIWRICAGVGVLGGVT